MRQPQSLGFWNGLATGGAVGFIVAFAAAALLDMDVRESVESNVVEIFTVVATVGAALLAYLGICRQIQQVHLLNQDQRKRRLSASRSLLPLVLTELDQICRNRIIYELTKHPEKSEPVGLMSLSDGAVAILRDCIESEDPPNSERIAEVIVIYQIVVSRSRDVRNQPVDKESNTFDYDDDFRVTFQHSEMGQMRLIFDWATLRVISNLLFDYARGIGPIKDRTPIRDAVITTVDFLQFPDGRYVREIPKVDIVIKRARGSEVNFPLSFGEPI